MCILVLSSGAHAPGTLRQGLLVRPGGEFLITSRSRGLGYVRTPCSYAHAITLCYATPYYLFYIPTATSHIQAVDTVHHDESTVQLLEQMYVDATT